jgi:hypothetical protein
MSDRLTERVGLRFIVRYLQSSIEHFPDLNQLFGPVRKHSKGHPIIALFTTNILFLFRREKQALDLF